MKAIIVHRWDGNPQTDWYQWLKRELEKHRFHVEVPKMPNTAEPKIDGWVSQLRESIGITNEEIILIGHSIGCQTIMRYLASTSTDAMIRGAVFVAGWFSLENLESEEIEEIARPWLTKPIDFEKINKKTNRITVFLSANDPYGRQEKNKQTFQEKLNAKVIIEENKGHFTADDGVTEVPEVVHEVITMVRGKHER